MVQTLSPALLRAYGPTLYDVAREALLVRSFREVVGIALRGAAKLIPAWRHSVGLIDVGEGTFTLYAVTGDDSGVFDSGTTVPLAEFGGDLERLKVGEPDLVNDIELCPRAVGSLKGTPLRSQLLVPVLDEGALVATVNIGSRERRYFTEEHIALTQELARIVGAALRQVRFQQDLRQAHELAMIASRSKSAFLANISHEFRTPLNAIVGYTELLLEDTEDLQSRSDLWQIQRSSRHLLSLISEVLDLAKIESGKIEMELSDLELGPLLRDVEAIVSPLVAGGENRWELDLPEALPQVRGDSMRLRQILFNLLGNAAKFTQGGVVSMRVRHDAGRIAISIADTGVGIPAEDLPSLFEAFSQAHNTRVRDFGGTGLGLSISRRYAQAMGGDITVESEVGSGSCFTVVLEAVVAMCEQSSA